MNIKATFPAGVTDITVHGLHQWDYGRTLEITAPDLPAVVEVHFACPGMKEAVVRVCSAANGTASAVIPDRCLEQTAPITAWVFVTDDTAGFTAKTITLPVIPRVKPQPGESVPEEHYDKYTELITQVNNAVATLQDGNVKVATAAKADHATTATTADKATLADKATIAEYASADTSKGTIEERLAALGFKEGSVAIPAGTSEITITGTSNALKKQGKCTIGVYNLEIDNSNEKAITIDDLQDDLANLGVVPEGFRPAQDITLAPTFTGVFRLLVPIEGTTSYQWLDLYGSVLCTATLAASSGAITINAIPVDSSVQFYPFYLNIELGYETA